MYNIFETCILCTENNTMYNGDRKKRLESKDMIISTNSPVAQIIANVVEDGQSERQAIVIANKYLLKNAQDFITRN